MKPGDFKSDLSGLCRLEPGGYHVFIPKPLPPVKIEVDWSLASLLSEADRSMAELSGAGRLLPNPYLLIKPYLRKEAILSSQIENTFADLEELALFEAEPDVAPRRPDVQEVANYVLALEEGLRKLNSFPISNRMICELHQILMRDVRGGESGKMSGEYRNRQNWIGHPGDTPATARFVPPPPEEMHKALQNWEQYLHAASEEPPLVKCALLHYQFEAIHPFIDGNGRMGRLLITLFLCWKGCLANPLLYLSGYFDATRNDYYRLLCAVSQEGRWREWVEYFLAGVKVQSKAALEDTRRILDVYGQCKAKLKSKERVPKAAALVLDEAFANPIVTACGIESKSDESYLNVRKGIDFWINNGLLRELPGRKRNRLYIADELLSIMSAKEAKGSAVPAADGLKLM